MDANLGQGIYIYCVHGSVIWLKNAHFSCILALGKRMAFNLASRVTANQYRISSNEVGINWNEALIYEESFFLRHMFYACEFE